MDAQVPESVKKKRNETFRLLGKDKNLLFRKKHLDAEIDVVVENRAEGSKDMLTGLTDNYIRVLIDNIDDSQIGRKIPVRITKVDSKSTICKAL